MPTPPLLVLLKLGRFNEEEGRVCIGPPSRLVPTMGRAFEHEREHALVGRFIEVTLDLGGNPAQIERPVRQFFELESVDREAARCQMTHSLLRIARTARSSAAWTSRRRVATCSEPIDESDIAELQSIFVATGIGSRAAFDSASERAGSFGLFIRSLTGLNQAAVQQAFSGFLENESFESSQMIRFVELVVAHLTTGRTRSATSAVRPQPAPDANRQ